ncbi:MAG: hypothetical protein FWE57_04815 [Chitinispirillia bacterium]|nr:hypothetical protein [Chitinispirillia bacterium]
MKKSAAILLMSICCFAAAQERQTIAIYMVGTEPWGAKGMYQILGAELAKTISMSERYSTVERNSEILEQMVSEYSYQASGIVDDGQRVSPGRQHGVKYLCMVQVRAVGNTFTVEARLVDLETAKVERIVTEYSGLRSVNEKRLIAQKVAYELIEFESARKQAKQEQIRRARKKKALVSTAVIFDILGAGAIAYGVMENRNLRNHTDNNQYKNAETAEKKRNLAYIAGGALMATGLSIHIFF